VSFCCDNVKRCPVIFTNVTAADCPHVTFTSSYATDNSVSRRLQHTSQQRLSHVCAYYENVYNIRPHNVSVTCLCIMRTSIKYVPTTSQSPVCIMRPSRTRVCVWWWRLQHTSPQRLSRACVLWVRLQQMSPTTSQSRVCVYYEDVYNTSPQRLIHVCVCVLWRRL